MSIDDMRQALKAWTIQEIADGTGLHYNTVRVFMMQGSNPNWRTIQAIEEWLKDDKS